MKRKRLMHSGRSATKKRRLTIGKAIQRIEKRLPVPFLKYKKTGRHMSLKDVMDALTKQKTYAEYAMPFVKKEYMKATTQEVVNTILRYTPKAKITFLPLPKKHAMYQDIRVSNITAKDAVMLTSALGTMGITIEQ
jgi:hypothetical protein